MDCQNAYRRAAETVSQRLGRGANVLSDELFDGLVAREILVFISQNSQQPGYEQAAALAGYALTREISQPIAP